MKKYIYSLGLLFFAAFIACESDNLDIINYGTIEGQVMDGETYLPLAGVMISTTPASVTLLTDAEGKFSIPKVKEGDIDVNLEKKDYLSNSLKVAVFEGEVTNMDFLIFKDYNETGNIVIYDPVPGNGAVDQKLALTLKWNIEGKKPGIEVLYNIYLFESNSTVQNLLSEDVILKEVTTDNLKPNTTYFWYVVARHDGHRVANSPTWTFKTGDE
ncbi:MAG: carboxypeptidase-like regulatory domain-containing protein [Porphyromonadaceae bacterium]|nr:carboxypeptidase-like regulatory domain-containing protein [Porphyromonadaceae bacterium]